ncbi:MAG: acid phosphatase [Acidobacteria bacterium]|nr:acid phosphatase [Acidobacteriota bacterium]
MALCIGALTLGLLGGVTVLAQAGGGAGRRVPRELNKIKNVIIIYQENWSFDGLYGKFKGANGFSNAPALHPQVDKAGKPLDSLPQALKDFPLVPDPRFPPANGGSPLPAAPFDLTRFVAPDERTGDLIHRFYTQQLQINGGKMDKFVPWSDNPGLVLSYIDASELPEGLLAREFVLCDNFFHSGFGGSFFNHQFMIAAAPPRWPNAPSKLIADPDPQRLKDSIVTPDGFAVNTVMSIHPPHPKGMTADPSRLLPSQTHPTIGDRLGERGVSWKWYAGGWDEAAAGKPDPLFQFHHQPFVYFERYKKGSAARKKHLRDEVEFIRDLAKGKLPSVSFVKPLGNNNEHPGYAALLQGQQHVARLVDAVRKSKYWKNSVIIITYDENGGRWDHVAPPVIDRFGPGTRVPAIIISPFAKRNFVDHTQYETVSILRFLELRYGLKPLTDRDANAAPLLNAFDFRH